MKKTNEQIALKVSRTNIIWNIGLAVFMLITGLITQSTAVISDGFNTLSDIFSTLIVMLGVKLANKEADQKHPYGHDRFECVVSIVLAAILFSTGISIGYNGWQKIINGAFEVVETGLLAPVAALLSIIIKESMYYYTRKHALAIDSSVLLADAQHHRSDSLSSTGALIGVLGAYLGFPILDPLACLVICLLIIKSAVEIFRDAIDKLTDKACDSLTIENMRSIILAHKEVLSIDELNTRVFNDKIYVDVDISVASKMTLEEAHSAAHHVHDMIENHFPKVKHCMVHVNPADN